MVRRVDPLTWNVPIVDSRGNPTQEFMRKWGTQNDLNGGIPEDVLDGQVLGNITGGGKAVGVGLSALIDHVISSTRGVILYRGVSSWVALPPGAAGLFLKTNGAGADPAWATPSVQALLDGISNVEGTMLYRNNTQWAALPPGTAKYRMRMNAAGVAPEWSLPGLVRDVLTEATTARTLALTDAGAYIRCTNASATTVTVPTNATVAFDIGATVSIRQAAAGAVTVSAAVGVTINAPFLGTLVTAGQGALVQLVKVATDTWDLFGQTQ